MDDQIAIQKTDGINEQNPLIQDRTVVALFASEDDARHAEQALIEAGYDKVVVTWNGEEATDAPKAAHDHGFWASLKAFFGDHKDASLYGEGLRRGQTLVTVHTQQGRAALAVDILDRFNPTDVEGAEQSWHSDGEAGRRPIDDMTAEDRPAYLAAAADLGEQTLAGGRDLDAGNARVRSYFPSGMSDVADDDVAIRADDSVLNDTDEDGPLGDKAEAGVAEAPNKAWLGRTQGMGDKDRDPEAEG